MWSLIKQVELAILVTWKIISISQYYLTCWLNYDLIILFVEQSVLLLEQIALWWLLTIYFSRLFAFALEGTLFVHPHYETLHSAPQKEKHTHFHIFMVNSADVYKQYVFQWRLSCRRFIFFNAWEDKPTASPYGEYKTMKLKERKTA